MLNNFFTRTLPIALLIFTGACNSETQTESAAQPSSTEKIESIVTHQVLMKTSMGDITLDLYGEDAPISVENFLSYINDDFYDGLIFHRVIGNFMIQGGGFDAEMTQKPTKDPIKNEAQNGLSNVTGTLAMARTGIIDSATSQFFINVVDNPFLDFTAPNPRGFGYAVFGKISAGMEVVEKIKLVETENRGRGHANVPTEAIIIEDMQVLSN